LQEDKTLTSRLRIIILATLVALLANPAVAQDNLGTSFGLPNASPAVSWPHGSSLEVLGGTNRLYPNGPEFGLSNTAGGFGMIGSGPMSGIGLVQNSVSPLVREELERPLSDSKRLTDVFRGEAARSSLLYSTVLSGQFRSELARPESFQIGNEAGYLFSSLPNVDSVLGDQAATTESILKNSGK
jgi:hypothetical protein